MKSKNINKTLILRNTINRFIGCLVRRGNKVRALSFFNDITEALRSHLDKNPVLAILDIFDNIKPSVSLYTKKMGGTQYKIPNILTEEQSYAVAIHWIIGNARKRSEKTFKLRIVAELLDTHDGKNVTLIKRRDEIHKIALSNRPFLRFK